MEKNTDTDTRSKSADSIVFWEERGDVLMRVGSVPADRRDLVCATILELGQRQHGNAEPVRVVHIDEAQAKKWLRPPFNAKPCHVDQLFPSARAVSAHLGFPNRNEVGNRLAKALRLEHERLEGEYGKGTTVRPRPQVIVRGITLQYEKDVHE